MKRTQRVGLLLAGIGLLLLGGWFAVASQRQALAAEAAPAFGSAFWVWDTADAEQRTAGKGSRYFRHEFELAAAPESATLGITADDKFTAWVNGQKVGESATWQDPKQFDVAKLLVAGKNAVAIEANNNGGDAGLIAELSLGLPNKKTTRIATSEKWKVTVKQPEESWKKAGFDDSTWKRAEVIGDASIGPWTIASKLGSSAKLSSNSGPFSSTNLPGVDKQVADSAIKSYRPSAEQAANFILPEGYFIELVASEPTIINPVCIALDEQGRLYVSESHTYRYGPSGTPVKPFTNPIVRLDLLPDGKGYKRTLVAEGFDDPVMGMVIRDGYLWATANNYLYHYKLNDDAPATEKQTLMIDKSKAWNPFGMFVLEWGPDGMLYLSVGNHDIKLESQKGKEPIVSGRGSSGIVVRMKPDGTNMQRLVHGLRVPYSFEYDPFGQLWLLSNGEGNPNRFVRVIDGVDYHCYSRPAADNDWLAGKHRLAPPTFELPRGACTQLIRYYGSEFPASMQGNLLINNWGAHGFSGVNRTVDRYVTDETGKVTEKLPWLSCKDPHFRSAHILLAPDGSLLVADWYGRDDESDMTGRIWRIRYNGPDKPKIEHELASPKWSEEAYRLSALSSPNHLIREKAVSLLAAAGAGGIDKIAEQAAKAANPLGAASALWALVRMNNPAALSKIAAGAEHTDARVRRLAILLAARYRAANVAEVAKKLANDASPEVRVEAAISLPEAADRRAALLAALTPEAAADPFVRYKAAWHLAQVTDQASLEKLLASENETLSTAGLIAIDVALYEKTSAEPAALASLGEMLVKMPEDKADLLFVLARLHMSEKFAPAMAKILASEKLPPAVIARALLLAKGAGLKNIPADQLAAARKKLLAAVADGSAVPRGSRDVISMLELIGEEGATPEAVRQIGARLFDADPKIRTTAHELARRFAGEAGELSKPLWAKLLAKTGSTDEKLQILTTLLSVEKKPSQENWKALLEVASEPVVADAIRSLRQYKEPAMIELLAGNAALLRKKYPSLAGDLATVLAQLGGSPSKLELPELEKRTPQRFKEIAEGAVLNTEHAALGRRVFERAGCIKCHTTVNQPGVRAPSLSGIGKQPTDYLVESFLEPSKIIKTGFETEVIQTVDGKTLTGLVREEGPNLLIYQPDELLKLPKSEVEQRKVQKISLMPTGLTDPLSAGEIADLVAYLKQLK